MPLFRLPECFSFLRPKPAGLEDGHYALPQLEEACALARRRRCKLACRSLTVIGKLCPVSCCILGDLIRCGGPKHGVKNARRLRKSLEDLGPAFIKLGQATASREDVLGPGPAAELRKLCDQVIPIPLEMARGLLNEELGALAPPLEGEPVAAASLGQVYRINVDGQEFAMKIQRPGLAEALAVDVAILLKYTSVFQRVYRCFSNSKVDFIQVTRAWATTLWQELDYEREAQSMDYMRNQLVGRVSGLVIPRVHWPLSGKRVLTTEWIQGKRVTESLSSITPRHIKIGVDAFATMVLDIGFVHADPHAGNVLITDSDDICLLDFGMVVEVPFPHRMAWAKCLYAMIRKDHNQTLDNLIQIGFFPPDCPRERVLEVLPKIWEKLVDCGSDIKKRKEAVQECYGEILAMVREFNFDLPDYYLALARAMITLEGIAVAADLEFDIFKAAIPPVLRYLAAQGVEEAVNISRRVSTGAVNLSRRVSSRAVDLSRGLSCDALNLSRGATSKIFDALRCCRRSTHAKKQGVRRTVSFDTPAVQCVKPTAIHGI